MNSRRRQELAKAKLNAIRGGRSPRVLDLFSGCGGMTLGFKTAGCEPLAGAEKDPEAARSYALNFHAGAEPDAFERHAEPKDVRDPRWSPKRILKYLGHSRFEEAVDIIIGGPPCPSFSRIGRAKLAFRWDPRKRDRDRHHRPHAYLEDERTVLFHDFLRHVRELAPVAVVMENVPEFLNHGGTNHAEIACNILERLGYECRYSLLNAASYGVPQWRDRFFLVAIHSCVGATPAFPEPTHSLQGMPVGYRGRRTHLRLEEGMIRGGLRYIAPPEGAARFPPVTAEEAIGDLPKIRFRWDEIAGEVRVEYVQKPYEPGVAPSRYAQRMRKWLGPLAGERAHENHLVRLLQMRTGRDVRIFERMREGAEYPEAWSIGLRLGEAAIHRTLAHGRLASDGPAERAAIMDRYRPPYDPAKFSNKWWKLRRDAPSRTLTAHLGKDTYSHIHYDSDQARVITVQEAARLQSIPDGFRLEGRMNARFRQIGNSVPPLLARHVAGHLLQQLTKVPLRR